MTEHSASRIAACTRQYTASRIADAAGLSDQTVRGHYLGSIPADGFQIVAGNQTKTWLPTSFPPSLVTLLADRARKLKYRDWLSLLDSPPKVTRRTVSLANFAPEELERAASLRRVLQPSLERIGTEDAKTRNAAIVARYGETFGVRISTSYAAKLFARALQVDGGAHDWSWLALYLPENPKPRILPKPRPVGEVLCATLPKLHGFLTMLANPATPSRAVRESVWRIACEETKVLMVAGVALPRAQRMIRDYLQARAPWLAVKSRDALRKEASRHWQDWTLGLGRGDHRAANGKQAFLVPEPDLARLAWATSTKHGKVSIKCKPLTRLDEAWRGEYRNLSPATRDQFPPSYRCPKPVRQQVNMELTRMLTATHQGLGYLDRLLGTLSRDTATIPSYHTWVMDDLTVPLMCWWPASDGSKQHGVLQAICVLDVRSRKFVGSAFSIDKGPTADLVTKAFSDAAVKTGKVPKNLGLENGWTFGRSHNVVGKRAVDGDLINAGLAKYGCAIHHFKAHSPTSKAELEKGFDLLQNRLEQHPGYTGRNQMLAAPAEFKAQQTAVTAGRLDPESCWYSYEEAVRVICEAVEDYNRTPQSGALAGLSPNKAFARFIDPSNPPIELSPELLWLLSPNREQVTVKATTHVRGAKVKVRGGRLPEFIGRKLWAVTERQFPDVVTFMTLDFKEVFTEPVCKVVDIRERDSSPESGTLASELRKIGQTRQHVVEQYQGHLSRFGNPREQHLLEARERSQLEAASRADALGPRHGGDPLPHAHIAAQDRSMARPVVMDASYYAALKDGARQRREIHEAQKRRAAAPYKSKLKARALQQLRQTTPIQEVKNDL